MVARDLNDEEWIAYAQKGWGLPPAAARSTLGTMQAIAAGEFDCACDDYQKITGRPARTMREFLTAFRDRQG